MTNYQQEDAGSEDENSNHVPPITPSAHKRKFRFGLKLPLLGIGLGSVILGYLSMYEQTNEFVSRSTRDPMVKAYVEMKNKLGCSKRYVFTDTNGIGVPDTIIEETTSPFDTAFGMKPVTCVYDPSDGKRPSDSLVKLGSGYVKKPASIDEKIGGIDASLGNLKGLGKIINLEQDAEEYEQAKKLRGHRSLEYEFDAEERRMDDLLGK